MSIRKSLITLCILVSGCDDTKARFEADAPLDLGLDATATYDAGKINDYSYTDIVNTATRQDAGMDMHILDAQIGYDANDMRPFDLEEEYDASRDIGDAKIDAYLPDARTGTDSSYNIDFSTADMGLISCNTDQDCPQDQYCAFNTCSVPCMNTDNGDDRRNFGSVTGRNIATGETQHVEDYCLDANLLVEYHCATLEGDEVPMIFFQINYNCADYSEICVNGQCQDQ